MSLRLTSTWAIIAVVATVAALGLLAHHYRESICNLGQSAVLLIADKDRLRIWLESRGSLAPLFFMVIQTLQVVIAPIPGEVTGFLGGYLFGVAPGFLYSTVGLTLGSALAFSLGRWLETHFIEKWMKKETLEKFAFLIERQGALVAFLLFLIPGAPKDYLSIILGLSRMSFKVFLLIVFLGRMPATFLLTLQGVQVYRGNYLTFLGLVILLLTVGGVLLLNREKIYQWLRTWGDNS
jgi:uncharacterized membrane protein YdjX (TVP38/TMEM64 family)